MRIGMILERTFPDDIRVEKEARALLENGHQVFLLCRESPGSSGRAIYEGIRITRCNFYHALKPLQKIMALSNMIQFKNGVLIRRIKKFIAHNTLDVLHVHDLPMVRSALIASKAKIPVVADFHENYPEAMKTYLNSRSGLRFRIKNLLNGYNRWKAYERKCAEEVAHLIVVVEEAKQRLTASGIPAEKITVVSNTEDVGHFLGLEIDGGLIERYAGHFVITYTGGFGAHRGLETVIKAVPRILEEVPNLKLLLVGAGYNQDDLEKLTRELGVTGDVVFTGWQPFHLVPSYIQLSDVCVIPHHASPLTDSTIPHKLFQYMLMEKPVVVSNCKPLERIIQETKAGLVFRSGDSADFANKCLELLYEKKRKKMGQNGRKAVLNKYNWKETGKSLTGLYEKLMRAGKV